MNRLRGANVVLIYWKRNHNNQANDATFKINMINYADIAIKLEQTLQVFD